eukprot:COSAG01_NODE_425_length_17240_cov_29.899306_4_plen_67_part_00
MCVRSICTSCGHLCDIAAGYQQAGVCRYRHQVYQPKAARNRSTSVAVQVQLLLTTDTPKRWWPEAA